MFRVWSEIAPGGNFLSSLWFTFPGSLKKDTPMSQQVTVKFDPAKLRKRPVLQENQGNILQPEAVCSSSFRPLADLLRKHLAVDVASRCLLRDPVRGCVEGKQDMIFGRDPGVRLLAIDPNSLFVGKATHRKRRTKRQSNSGSRTRWPFGKSRTKPLVQMGHKPHPSQWLAHLLFHQTNRSKGHRSAGSPGRKPHDSLKVG